MKFRLIPASPNARFYLGLALSLLIHAMVLLFYLDQPEPHLTEPEESRQTALQVQLLPQPPAPEKTARRVIAPPAPQPEKAVQTRPQPPATSKNSRQQRRDPKPSSAPRTVPAERKFDPNMDMADMLQAARDRRRAAGIQEPASSQPAPQDDSAIARANVQELLNQQTHGRDESGGVFQITYKGVRNAEFIFYGWNTKRNINMRQLIQVDAGLGGDVDTAIVRRMIDIIRQSERGDFQWESRRLGRTVTLSARPRDSHELEAFLKKEFLE